MKTEIPHSEPINNLRTTTENTKTETLSTDTTDILLFKLTQILENESLTPDLDMITIERQKIHLKL